MDVRSTVEKCRVCSADMPVTPGYTTWCDHCGWNIEGKGYERKNSLEKFYDFLGKKWNEHLLNSIKNTTKIVNKISATKIIAVLLALPIYFIHMLIIIAYAALAVLMISVISDIIILIFLITIFTTIPVIIAIKKIRKQKKIDEYLKDSFVDRGKFPKLYELVGKISDHLGISQVDGIIIDEEYNASFGRYSKKNKKILTIGIPLFYILNDKEKIALISHEIAHAVNNDAYIGKIVGRALNILADWYISLTPNRNMANTLSHTPMATLLIPFCWLLSRIILIYWYLLSIVSWRDSQCAEYYADYLASSISGPDAMGSMLEKLYYDDTFNSTVDKAVRFNEHDILDRFSERIKSVPQRELDRIKKLIFDKRSQIDSTHPPTAFRIEFIRNKKIGACNLFQGFDFGSIDAELQSIRTTMENRMKQYYQV